MNLPVQTTREADAQIREIDDWWRRNRFAAPDLFLDELTASLTILGHAPQTGRLYRKAPIPGTRRMLLKTSRYHLYYVLHTNEVKVLALWHAQRGVGPPLRAS